jgi:lipopolysaccharide export system protein LptA
MKRAIIPRRLMPAGIAAILFFFAVAGGAAETFAFSADRVESVLAEGKERTLLTGRAKVKSDTLDISADRIELSGKDYNLIDCSGNVSALDSDSGFKISTSRLVYDRSRKFSHMEGATVVEDRKNKLVLKAQWIDNDDRNKVLVAEVNVRILKEKLSCRAEYAIYRRDAKSLELSGAPSAWKDGDLYRATRIVVNTDTEEVRLEGEVQGTITTTSKGSGAAAAGQGGTVQP